ncbi:MAG: hypothetical protein PHY45_18240 [Rhodocyclaceae bacterium]|nr:hypothetical protein [Rhodocyclaceae bacterium]
MDDLHAVASLGFTLPTPAYLAGALLFSLVGFAAYRYGKKAARSQAKWIGVALMFYPYAISETWQLYAVGAALCASLYWLRD